jgi:tetratricopeptide (TPR) repeat protein
MSIEPPATDSDNQPPAQKPTNAKRTLLLWVVLIIAFIAIYNLFTPSGPRPDPGPVQESHWLLRYLMAFIPWGVMAALLGALFWNGKRAQQYNRAAAPALRALNQRRLAEAESAFTAQSHVAGRAPFAGAVAHYNLAMVRLQRGNLDGAAADFGHVERWAGLAFGSDLRVLAAAYLAHVNALRGDAGLARRWLDVARRRLPAAGDPANKVGVLSLAEALVLLREGKHREALAVFDQHVVELETTVPYDTMRQWWALMAFARWQDAGPRDQGAIDVLLRRLQPSRPHELGHLVVAWPELRGFLETHGVPAEALARD